MACLHRFHETLLPKNGMHFLFIGTFNPMWDVKSGDNPDFFYSRDKSQFWCILPHAFNQHCLIDKDKPEKELFCNLNRIGLTDLIYCIENVDEKNQTHREFLAKGFKDEMFELKNEGKYLWNIDFFTKNIQKYVETNHDVLKGVFFTRKTERNIERIWREWLSIRNLCKELNIYADEVASPSVRGGGIRSKIFSWRQTVESARAHKRATIQ